MKYINREKIIEALKTEPLKRGAFFHNASFDNIQDAYACEVCAVGAVLRRCFNIISDVSGFVVTRNSALWEKEACSVTLRQAIKNELKIKNYMGALSIFFESQDIMYSAVTPLQRRNLIRFVKRNLPNRVAVNL